MRRRCSLDRLATVFTLLLCLPAAADDGLQRLEAFIDGTQSLRAAFTQEVIDRDQAVVERASGHFFLARPGRFRWQYEQPFERLIVSDGERVWLYEADLEQVTVRRIGAALGSTPAALLSGSRDVLDAFEVLGTDASDGLAWVTLGPRDSSADFASMRLGFAGADPAVFVLTDRLGQQTRIRFEQVERNPALPAALFTFAVPAGADVIDESEL
ncbi:MAG: outer membrane lipoprotein carrier protein LolA [Gammaproteobacteria bacterium]|nr:MAG: outer membrane lipoprotein carrier protein LolA [Gammaproteobacteria bacterium]